MPLSLDHVSYVYGPGSPYETRALSGVDLTIEDGEFAALIGPTGSGKSTLLQVLGGLLRPSEGTVRFDGKDIYGAGFSRKEMHQSIGLIFQYPEYQLFADTVLKDAAFGPQNLGLSEEEVIRRAKRGLTLAGLPEKCWEMSPFDLSGGEKRRAAIGGVLAMEPRILVLDEPTAGLDPAGRRELFSLLRSLHEEQGMTILLVSHSMEDVAEQAGRVIVLQEGKILYDGTPGEVFAHGQRLEEIGLALPEMTRLSADLAAAGVKLPDGITTLKEAKSAILQLFGADHC